MGLRESLNENPKIGYGIAAGGLIIVVLLFIWSLGGGGGAVGSSDSPQRYYTVDDGKTWFADDYEKIPPFEKDGKQAVLANVYRDLDNKEDFVAYLTRYTPETKKAMEERRAKGTISELGPLEGAASGIEYKRPGESAWIKSTDPRAGAMVSDVRSPKGSVNVEPVFP